MMTEDSPPENTQALEHSEDVQYYTCKWRIFMGDS